MILDYAHAILIESYLGLCQIENKNKMLILSVVTLRSFFHFLMLSLIGWGFSNEFLVNV
jgi:hypothetical protein